MNVALETTVDGFVKGDGIRTLGSQLSRGELSLLTGAGFSRDALATDGMALPGVWELMKILWPIAFPDEPVDEKSRLGEVFQCAVQQSSSAVERELKRCLTVDAGSLGESYTTWFSMPWRRVYTLNIDDLPDALSRSADLPVRLRVLSALSDEVPAVADELVVVHLNGRLSDGADVTFSPLQYADRLPGSDVWYPTLAHEIAGRPFMFVGSVLDESPLWQHLALRGKRGSGRELRPRSYLVSPEVPAARRRLLGDYNITHIATDQATFADEVLSRLSEEATSGHKKLRRRRDRRDRSPLLDLADLREEPGTSVPLSSFLTGREPEFRDITDGYAVTREFERDWPDDPSLLDPRITLLTGTAGSGKSTTMRRLALELHAKGLDVRWLDTDTDVEIRGIHKYVGQEAPDVLFIDDVDIFGGQSGPFMVELVKKNPRLTLVASARSTRSERFELRTAVQEVDNKLVVVPPLGDADVDGLIQALTDAGVLGKLAGKPFAEQRSILRDHAGRQLLVAMIEATSGRKFDDKVDDECSQLPAGQALIYAIIAIATRLRAGLARDEVLLAAGGEGPEHLADLEALVRQHMVVVRDDLLYIRHRVIAERAAAFFRRSRQLGPAVEGLLWTMAARLTPNMNRHARERQLAIKLMNHKFMIEEVTDVAQVRSIYESIRQLLASDAHFWLQRGSFEVESGDLDSAENYLDQARGLKPDDYKIQTEYAYMQLKRAAEDTAAGRPGWRDRASEAFKELNEAIRRRGKSDSYPYHILGSQGLAYARRAPLTTAERSALLGELIFQIKEGLRHHPGQGDLIQLRDDLEREHLSLAVDTNDA